MTIPQNFIKLRPGQYTWGRRGDLWFIGGKWEWVGMCSFRVSEGQDVITPNKRIKSLRRGDVVQIQEKDGSTYGIYYVITAVAPENRLVRGRVDTAFLRDVESVETLRKDGLGCPTHYFKKTGWNIVDLPELLPLLKTFNRA